MDNEETNSAELAAEEILREAYPVARAEECPQGEACPVHFRIDDEYIDEESKYARLITYVGDYVVITEDNTALGSPVALIGYILGGPQAALPQYETSVVYVGSGVIGDVETTEQYRKALRYAKTHDDWDAVPVEHSSTVIMLHQDLIDVSKPWEG
jgi:hypothetical protein